MKKNIIFPLFMILCTTLNAQGQGNSILSSETVGWFTGVYVGFYATGNGKKCEKDAAFEYFEYIGN